MLLIHSVSFFEDTPDFFAVSLSLCCLFSSVSLNIAPNYASQSVAELFGSACALSCSQFSICELFPPLWRPVEQSGVLYADKHDLFSELTSLVFAILAAAFN